jgi:ribosomal-protein-alanine N-acetyltransferase
MDFTIKLRPLKLEDAAFINQLRQIDSMEKLIGGSARPVSLERDVKWVEDLMLKDFQHQVYYAVNELNDDKIIGYASITEIDYRNGTCFFGGIKIDQSKAGKGVGTQVALKILKIAFEEMRMVRVSTECQERHSVGLKMLHKAGYTKEGLKRKTLFKNGIHNNQWLLSVIDDEYREIKNRFNL